MHLAYESHPPVHYRTPKSIRIMSHYTSHHVRRSIQCNEQRNAALDAKITAHLLALMQHDLPSPTQRQQQKRRKGVRQAEDEQDTQTEETIIHDECQADSRRSSKSVTFSDEIVTIV